MKASDYGLEWPDPPAPPEMRVQCGCGFTAPKSEFELKHKRCWPKILSFVAVAMLGITFLSVIVFELLNVLGVI